MLTHVGSLSIGVTIFLAAHGTPCVGQSPPSFILPFYGQTTEEEREEARAWSVAFWERVESGNPQTFVPQQAAWQSPLFNPLRSTRATLERLKVIDPADCDWEIISATEGSPLWEKRQALKESMISGKFETDPVSNGEGFQEHLSMIFDPTPPFPNAVQRNADASPGQGIEAWMQDGKLVSTNLVLAKNESQTIPAMGIVTRSGPLPEGTSIFSLATPQQVQRATDAIQSMQAVIPAAAELCTTVSESQKLLTGAPSRADEIEQLVRQQLIAHGFDPLTTRYDAAFGVYGSLPIIQAHLGQYVCFVDGQVGAVYGPYVQEMELARRFSEFALSRHMPREYSGFDLVRVFAHETGCQVKFASVWVPWTQPATPLPVTPWPATPLNTLPGWPKTTCSFSATTGICTCTVERTVSVVPCPTGAPVHPVTLLCAVKEISECTWTTGRTGCTAPNPNWPTSPPPATGWPTPVATCTYKYGWWQ